MSKKTSLLGVFLSEQEPTAQNPDTADKAKYLAAMQNAEGPVTKPPQEPPVEQDQQIVDPNQMQQPAGGFDQFSQDPAMAGMPGMMPEQNTAKMIGRIFELKRIHNRLQTIKTMLDTLSDPKFDKLKSRVSESIELFSLISKHLLQFEQKIDEIIISFYDFIKVSIVEMEELIKEKNREDEAQAEEQRKNAKKKDDKDKANNVDTPENIQN